MSGRSGAGTWKIHTAGVTETYRPVCGDSPDYRVTIACAAARGNTRTSRVAPAEPAARAASLLPTLHGTLKPSVRRTQKQGGAPGRSAAANPRHAWLPSVHLLCHPGLVVTGLTWPDTPPAAGRAWVPGCRARTLLRPYPLSTTKSSAWKVPPRDRFVILISQPDHMPLTSGSLAAHPAAPASRFVAAQDGWDGIQPTYADSDRRPGRPQAPKSY